MWRSALREFCTQVSTSTSSRDFDPRNLATVTQKSLPFESALPSLQRLSLCYGILPVGLQFLQGLTPSFLPCTLPGLEELELSNDIQLEHSLWLDILQALPLLRVLKFNSIKFKEGVPISGVADIPRNVGVRRTRGVDAPGNRSGDVGKHSGFPLGAEPSIAVLHRGARIRFRHRHHTRQEHLLQRPTAVISIP